MVTPEQVRKKKIQWVGKANIKWDGKYLTIYSAHGLISWVDGGTDFRETIDKRISFMEYKKHLS